MYLFDAQSYKVLKFIRIFFREVFMFDEIFINLETQI